MGLLVSLVFAAAAATSHGADADLHRSADIRIGNFLVGAPCGIAFIVKDRAAFVVDTGGPFVAGTAAPDDSYHRQAFTLNNAKIVFEWGRVGDSAMAKLSADRPTEIPLKLSSGWPDLVSRFQPRGADVMGEAKVGTRKIGWHLNTELGPARPVFCFPTSTSANSSIVLVVTPDRPGRFVAGFGRLPAIREVDRTLADAAAKYARTRARADGDWGDFVGAIADNMNNSRIYSTDNHRLAHSVSRRWAGGNPDNDPYFCWDSFFTADLACIDDPVTARDTVRAILSCQTKEGLVPNFGHWNFGKARSSDDRSQPPVGSLCVWRMHERRPDLAFLREVYPKLAKWHAWWPEYRDGNHNGLLEWGSSTGDWQNAQYETGWDDNLHFAGTRMEGSHMNADAVDLSSMWSMDAEFLAKIAEAIGRHRDAAKLRAEHAATNRKINQLLWNEKLGMYCSRLWHPERVDPLPTSGFDAVFFSDEKLETEAARRHDSKIDFDWGGKEPLAGVPANHWSARWSGSVTAPADGTYRMDTTSDDGIRVRVDGKLVIDNWSVHASTQKLVDVYLKGGQPIPVVVEYFQHDGGSSLHFSIGHVVTNDPQAAYLTRITPMNFYPLLAGAPDRARGALVMKKLTDPKQFFGPWTLPTLSYGDPNYHQQEYWRGDVWGPVNYLVWQGIRRYASPQQQLEFARRSVRLFMRNWISSGICSENYYCTTGTTGGDPHYTWGALLCLVGLECVSQSSVRSTSGVRLVRVDRDESKSSRRAGRHLQKTPPTANR
jgi:glycogen debranching enzyme